MPEGLIILVFAALVVLIIVGAYYSHQANKKRLAELTALAAARGWQFDSSENYSHEDRFGQFALFTRGDDRYAYNTLLGEMTFGEQAWPVQMGDYHYKTTSRSTDSKGRTHTTTHHHYFSYVLIETPFVEAPELFIRREGFFDKVAGFFGFDDIDFESSEFSSRFVVKSADKRFAYDVIHPRMMEFLLEGDPPTIELERGPCCLTRSESRWSAAQFEAMLAWAQNFFGLWPRHLEATIKDKA
jgi:hypothetical protein